MGLLRREPAAPSVCEHHGKPPAFGICACVCRHCWSAALPIGQRCVDPQCLLHHPLPNVAAS